MADGKFIAIEIGQRYVAIGDQPGTFRISTTPFIFPFSNYTEDELRECVDNASLFFERRCEAVELVCDKIIIPVL